MKNLRCLYKQKLAQSVGKFEIESLNAADDGLTYNTKTNEKETNIYDVIPTAKKGYYSEFEIIKGELYYKGDVEQKLIWAKELGIGIIPYEIVDGVLISANSNLLLLDSTGTVRIPYNVTKIDRGVFNNLEGLTRVIIPGSVKEIGTNAFSNNTSLQEVIMEDGVEKIDGLAFGMCTNLKSVQIPNSVRTIANQAFYGCSSLKSINLPDNLQSIASYTFTLCSSLESIDIPDSVETFGNGCFSHCRSLKEIYIPSNLTDIYNSTFEYCTSLDHITISPSNTTFILEKGSLYNSSKTVLYFVLDNQNTNEITIQEGIVSIREAAFSKFPNVEIVNLPSTVNNLTSRTFSGVSKLKTINISNNNTKYSSDGATIYENSTSTLLFSLSKDITLTVKDGTKIIGSYAFQKCNNLENLILNNDLEEIKVQALDRTKIKDIYIPASVKKLDPIFVYNLNINTINIDPNNMNYTSDDKFIYNKNKTEIVKYYKNETSVVIPEGVEKIGNMAFHGKSITNVTIPNTVKEIGD